MYQYLISTSSNKYKQGSKSHLIDHNGTKYLDTRNNVAHVGHQNPNVIQAVTKQLSTLNTNSRYLHPNSVLLAQRLVNLFPSSSASSQPNLSKVFFVNSGSEANDLALRLARAYSKSKNVIMVDNAYHGHTLATLDISPYKYKKSKEYENISCGHEHESSKDECGSISTSSSKTPGDHLYEVPCPDTFRGRYYFSNPIYNSKDDDNDPQSQQQQAKVGKTTRCQYDYAKDVEDACQYFVQQKNEKVGAFIIEGGMSVGGVILPPPSYLKRCADAVRKAGGVYIADEVQTGFGRLGSCFWGFQYSQSDVGNNNDGVIPDIVTVGKPFGNGMPLAAVITTEEVSNAFESMDVEYFNTFGGNPVSCASGLAVLDEIESKQLQQNAYDVGKYLMHKLNVLKQDLHIIGDVRGNGLFIGIDLITDEETLQPATRECSFLCTVLKQKYFILTSIDGPYDNVLVIKPPLCFSRDDVDVFVSAFESAVRDDLSQIDLNSVSKTPT